MPETLECVLKRLIADGMTRFDTKRVYKEAMNALDVDYYSFDEVKALFRKLLNNKGNK